MSFIEKRLDVTIQLGKGSFGEGGFDTVKLQGFRVSANIVKGADPTFDKAELRVYGLRPSIMNQVSTLGRPAFFDRVNQVTIEAGDAKGGMNVVYAGIIQEAFQDFTDAPNTCMNMTSNVGLVSATKPIPPSSYPGSASVATIMADIAARMTPPCAFENNGVNTVLSSPYYPGTALEQMRRVKEHANIEATIDGNVLAIWPKGQARGAQVIDIGPKTGLVNYPQFSGTGFVRLQTLYMPGLRLNGDINLTTSINPAGGRYRLCDLTYELEALVPNGKWFANMQAYRPDTGATNG